MLGIFDVHFIDFVIFSQYFITCSQYLLTYMVPGVKALPGWGEFGLSRGPGPPRILLVQWGLVGFTRYPVPDSTRYVITCTMYWE